MEVCAPVSVRVAVSAAPSVAPSVAPSTAPSTAPSVAPSTAASRRTLRRASSSARRPGRRLTGSATRRQNGQEGTACVRGADGRERHVECSRFRVERRVERRAKRRRADARAVGAHARPRSRQARAGPFVGAARRIASTTAWVPRGGAHRLAAPASPTEKIVPLHRGWLPGTARWGTARCCPTRRRSKWVACARSLTLEDEVSFVDGEELSAILRAGAGRG